jgi:LytS/YehU family sensor histidine kinase
MLYMLIYLAHLMNYLIIFLNRAEIDRVNLQRESAMAQYSALKNQIDPHFFFNNLSLLNSLLIENTDLATQFINHFSKLYRYILEVSADKVISLSEELARLESYFFLIRIRHGELIRFEIHISPVSRRKVFILPHSIQLLVENAVKHNTFRKDDPLVVEIGEDQDCIFVKNNLRKRELLQYSLGIGLENIRQRYFLESQKNIEIIETNSHFMVRLPKLKVHEDTGF